MALAGRTVQGAMLWGRGTDGASAAVGDDTASGGRCWGVPPDGEPRYQQRAERPARDAAARPRVDRQARLCSLDRGAADERIALQIGRAPYELQSQMRNTYDVF